MTFTWRRTLLTGLVLLLAVGIGIPFLKADGFRRNIQEGLEKALGRKVEIGGKVRFNVFTGPGFSAEDVVIFEDPAVGIEPFAYVSELALRVKPSSLWTGRLEFSSLRLDEPTLNLVKNEAASWNVQPLLARTSGTQMPDIEVRSARLNFKFDDTKSVFYLTNTDVDIDRTGDSSYTIRFSAEPARTDRAAQGFGTFTGRGLWKDGELSVRMDIEKSAIGEAMVLLTGRDIGLHGVFTGRTQWKGPLDHIAITGNLRVEEVHRWDLMPAKAGGWPVAFRGEANLRAGELSLDVLPADNPNLPLAVRVRARELLRQPRWAAAATLLQVPAPAVLEVLRHMGGGLPQKISADGTLTGVIEYTASQGIQGLVALRDGTVRTEGTGPVKLQKANLVFTNGQISLQPATAELESGQALQVEASYTPGSDDLAVRLTSRGFPMVRGQAGAIPLLDPFESLTWKGSLTYVRQQDKPGAWSGDFSILRATLPVPGLARPVAIEGATVRIDGDKVTADRLRGTAGEVEFSGDYRYDPELPRPHRLKVLIEKADAAELEALLKPTLSRREGFLARTLRFGAAPLPSWLASRHLEAAVAIASLTAGEVELGALKGRLLWDGGQAELVEASLEHNDLHASGKLSIRLQHADPEYRLQGKVSGLSWKGGELEGEGRLETSGLGIALARNARSTGTFQGRSLALLPEGEFRSVSGAFDVQAAKVRFSSLEAAYNGEVYQGQGAAENDGKLLFDLAAGKKQLRVETGISQ